MSKQFICSSCGFLSNSTGDCPTCHEPLLNTADEEVQLFLEKEHSKRKDKAYQKAIAITAPSSILLVVLACYVSSTILFALSMVPFGLGFIISIAALAHFSALRVQKLFLQERTVSLATPLPPQTPGPLPPQTPGPLPPQTPGPPPPQYGSAAHSASAPTQETSATAVPPVTQPQKPQSVLVPQQTEQSPEVQQRIWVRRILSTIAGLTYAVVFFTMPVLKGCDHTANDIAEDSWQEIDKTLKMAKELKEMGILQELKEFGLISEADLAPVKKKMMASVQAWLSLRLSLLFIALSVLSYLIDRHGISMSGVIFGWVTFLMLLSFLLRMDEFFMGVTFAAYVLVAVPAFLGLLGIFLPLPKRVKTPQLSPPLVSPGNVAHSPSAPQPQIPPPLQPNDFHEKAPQGQLKTAVHFVCRSRHFLFFAVMLSSSLCSCGTG